MDHSNSSPRGAMAECNCMPRSYLGSVSRPQLILQNIEVDFVIVRVKSKNGDEEIENIPKEEAICQKCYKLLQEEMNVVKTKCKCRSLSLIHEECAIQKKETKKCDVCEEVIQYIPITLSMTSGENLLKGDRGRAAHAIAPKNGSTTIRRKWI